MPFQLRHFCLLLLLPLVFSNCYENNIACLDPDATNYDLLADEQCPDDCCVFPELRIDVDRFWGENTLLLADTFTDGGNNRFRLLNFRVYLTDWLIEAAPAVLPVPENFQEVGVIAGTDTVLTELNANLALVGVTGSTTANIGRLRTGTRALTQVQARVGFTEDFPAVYPPSAPASSPLATQAGLLNFNDDRGYLSASAEYILTATDDTVRVDLYGEQSLVFTFPADIVPIRGANLTLEFAADYERVFGQIDLGATPATVTTALGNELNNWLVLTGIR